MLLWGRIGDGKIPEAIRESVPYRWRDINDSERIVAEQRREGSRTEDRGRNKQQHKSRPSVRTGDFFTAFVFIRAMLPVIYYGIMSWSEGVA
jgi:hypothetical protein